MTKNIKGYGKLKYVPIEEWEKLTFNPYRFSEGYARAEDGTLVEIYCCGNMAKKYHIPQYVAFQP